jgi:hypothetical protein
MNGDLAKGSGASPDHWRSESWDQAPDVSTYVWKHPDGGNPGELQISNLKPNDARWMQSLSLRPGWYRFEADIKTENVGNDKTGASISIMEDGIISAEHHGDSGWHREGFYLKVGRYGADVELALRLGGYSSLNTGRAFFRNVTVQRISGPPSSAEHKFDLDQIRKESATPPMGKPWSVAATLVALLAVAVVGWFAYGAAAAIEEAASGKTDRPKIPRQASRR